MKDFDFAYSYAKKSTQIQRQYLKKYSTKMEQLRTLHERVIAPGAILAAIVGILGTLMMGAGMAEVIVWNNLQRGFIIGVLGLLLNISAFPLYAWITGIRKKRYARQVYDLSNEIIRDA